MKINLTLATLLMTLCAVALASGPDYKIVDTIKIGGAAKWDYLYMDSAAHRLYVTHGTQTEVVDTVSDKVVGTITNTEGVHGVAIARDLGIGFTSNGASNTVGVFDLDTLKNKTSINVGTKPDAIVYDPATHKVLTFNGKSNNVSIIAATTLKVIATLAVAGKPEFSVVAGDGNVYFNIEDTGQLASIDPRTNKLHKPVSLKPCEEPTGLAVDDKLNLYSVCSNNLMTITSTAGKSIGGAKIGSGPDGVAFLDGYALSANGEDGTLTAVGLVDGKFVPVATIQTQSGARTITVDPATHRVYLPTADFAPPAKGEKRVSVPDSFHVLVLQQQ